MISTTQLIALCRRLGISLRSGVDARKVFESEARRGSAQQQAVMQAIFDRVAQGDTIAASMRDSKFFPTVAVAMVEIGEHTGRLDEALVRLAEHYEHQNKLQKQFLAGIAWPAIQLVIAVLVIGFLIFILGIVGSKTGSEPADILGIGITGTPAMILFFGTVGMVFTAVGVGLYALARGWFGPKPVELSMRLPVIGTCFECLAMSRLTWSLGMALDAGIDAKRSADLCLTSTQNPFYISKIPAVLGTIEKNMAFIDAFRDADGFPQDFLDDLENAEIAGTLSESLVRMSNMYDQRARDAMAMLTMLATGFTWALVAGMIIFMIFRLFFIIYAPLFQLIDDVEKGNF